MKILDIGQEKEIYGNGVHDDTKAIQNCLDRMKAGGTIHFPAGVYLVSSTLIFYSNQHLEFEEDSYLLRSAQSETLTRYILASYSEADIGGYDGTHNVTISGCTFDGNAELTEKITMLNTVHCKNITIKGCNFINCAYWHCIEINSSENILVKDCLFDGPSYTAMREDLTSELIQIDAPKIGTYGPVYNCDGKLIEFLPDETPCNNIHIEYNVFKCDGFTAIGHHGNDEHRNIKINNNIFIGSSGKGDRSRGYITFMEKVYDAKVLNNVFISVSEKSGTHYGIVTKNQEKSSCVVKENSFFGYFDEYFSGGITEENNCFEFSGE